MKFYYSILFFVWNYNIVNCQEACHIEINCNHCLPDYLPEITSHIATDNSIVVSHGEEIELRCHMTKFKAFPKLNTLKTICEDGNLRISNTTFVTDFSYLGCQADFFEDILHDVKYCNSTLQGRSYQYHNTVKFRVEHLAEICFDPEEKRTVFIHMTPHTDNNIVTDGHQDRHNKISMLENFNKMYDISSKVESEQVYYDELTMNIKMKKLFGRKNINLADQSLGIAKLLHPKFFFNQKKRITNFPSNKVGIWKSVLHGNYKHIQEDIIDSFCFNRSDAVQVYVGTHDTLSLSSDGKQHAIFLKPERRYPVPKFVYHIVYSESQHKAIALIVLNNPFISISEIRNTIFCPSICSQVSWLKNLFKNNNYERPTYGLVFCCDIHSFYATVYDGPNLILNVYAGEKGLLKSDA